MSSKALLILRWACRVAGPLLFALWLVPYLAVQFSPVRGAGSAVAAPDEDFALTLATHTGTVCTVTPDDGDSRTFTLSPETSIWTWGAAMGPVVPRWYIGPALISCTPGEVRVTTGQPVRLQPLARGWVAPGVALLLVVLGWPRRYVPGLRERETAGRTDG